MLEGLFGVLILEVQVHPKQRQKCGGCFLFSARQSQEVLFQVLSVIADSNIVNTWRSCDGTELEKVSIRHEQFHSCETHQSSVWNQLMSHTLTILGG